MLHCPHQALLGGKQREKPCVLVTPDEVLRRQGFIQNRAKEWSVGCQLQHATAPSPALLVPQAYISPVEWRSPSAWWGRVHHGGVVSRSTTCRAEGGHCGWAGHRLHAGAGYCCLRLCWPFQDRGRWAPGAEDMLPSFKGC